MNKLNLVALYFRICQLYDTELIYHCQRNSNNASAQFTDAELLTVYFFAMIEEEKFNIRSIHRFARRYLRSWFPQLPSYQAFNRRLNRLGPALQILACRLIEQLPGPLSQNGATPLVAVDSMPIIMAQGPRSFKANLAAPMADTGRCATKRIWYHGLKLHCLAVLKKGSLPQPFFIGFSPASVQDNTFFKEQIAPNCQNMTIFADRIYHDEPSVEKLQAQQVQLMCVQRKKSNQKNLTAYQKLYSSMVSRNRQPIESLFNWLIEKTDIQKASKVRSFNGLLVFLFGRIATAAFLWLGYY